MKLLRETGEILVLDANPPIGVGRGRVFYRRDVELGDNRVRIPSLQIEIMKASDRNVIAEASGETRFAILDDGQIVQVES